MSTDLQTPARFATELTADDTARFKETRAVFVGTGGTELVVVMAGDGSTVTFANVPDGTTLHIAIIGLLEDTDSSGVVALF